MLHRGFMGILDTKTGAVAFATSSATNAASPRWLATAFQRNTKLESFSSYSQADITPNSKQTATVSLPVYPQKLGYMGLNAFTPQPSTTDFKKCGYQVYAQCHRDVAVAIQLQDLRRRRQRAE
jgi:hypothetical protein